MKMMYATGTQRRFRLSSRFLGLIAACVLATGSAHAQSAAEQGPAARIQAEINGSQVSAIKGSQHPLAQSRYDAGRVPADTRLTGITIVFNRSAQQEADLQALLKAQQTPGSAQYHQWLTPDQFAARFGMAQTDIAAVQSWLESEGFSIDSVNRSHNAIHFSGSVAQVERAFSTEMHYYNVGGKKHFAPSTTLSVPSAFAGVVESVNNLHNFLPQPMHIRGKVPAGAKPAYTYLYNNSQYVFFTPGDIYTTNDIKAPIAAGYTGEGQTIAVIGQSAIVNSDIESFEQASGLTVKDPVQTLVPNTGTSAVVAGDESESDIDIEWAGAIATGATINFVYTGNSNTIAGTDTPNEGVFTAYQYAVDQKIGNVVSISYGSCETEFGATEYATYESVGEQAASQGQTVIASSGDSGATACYGGTDSTSTETVNYPASSQYVTGVGGTEITSADDAVGTYWSAASTTSGYTMPSAQTYIPEVAWNDDSLTAVSGCNATVDGQKSYNCVSAGSGGISTLSTAQPSWQTSYFTTTGTSNPSSGHRLVPDIALYASPNYPGYLICTSDQSAWDTQDGQTASCANGSFYDTNPYNLTVFGGTSFGAPIFAGMAAIVNQAKNYTTGQGLINPSLYSLAATSANVSAASSGQTGAALHDITSGNNECTQSSSYCPSSSGYSAGTGYDLVTGLGSIDLGNLLNVWAAGSSALTGTTTTVAVANTTPTVAASDAFTITVAPVSTYTGAAVPTGTVAVSVDGTAVSGSPFTLASNGTYVYTTSFATAGSHTITATYAGDTSFSSSTGTVSVNAQATSSGKGTFAMAFTPSTLTVAQGSQGTETLTVTPASGYTGTVDLNYDTSNDNALANLCVETGNNVTSNGAIVISNSTAVQGTIIIDANASDCATADGVAALQKRGLHVIPHAGKTTKLASSKNNNSPVPAGIAFAGLLLAGFLGRSSRKLRGLACVIALAAIGMAMTACGGGVANTATSNPSTGNYTITFTGTDSVTSSITNTASFQLTIN